MTFVRPRRLRSSHAIRELIAEVDLSEKDLIYPVFLLSEKDGKVPVQSMPGQNRVGLNILMKELGELVSLGLKGICLFPVVPDAQKSSDGVYSYNSDNFYLQAIAKIKEKYPELLVMTDVALDPYSTDGHDGIVDKKTGEILNDETLEVLVKMSLAQAQAGADIIGPSDMMDSRVGSIRKALENEGHKNTLIMSYTAKYASSFYGPFRDALDSAPKFGDKKTYQMDFRNSGEAIKEAMLDINEGADILMVKPAIAYLDIIAKLKARARLPISAYQVSGEYSMIKAAGMKGWLDSDGVFIESLTAIKRAGASVILSYYTAEFLKKLNS
ncbi:MAG: porphobilinogen synthase [Halobacteriovoraceae bacterium]|nr:porphobilinogen synthase [Halobacteriovoraceae bacterium]MCB9095735.1 porphobilinogen synthase [Halobacteriovoraceae bacterium]